MSEDRPLSRSQEAEFYRSLVEHFPVCIYRIDLEGRLTYGNSAYLEDVGASLDELLGKTVFELFPDEQAEKYHAVDQEVLRSGQVFQHVEKHEVHGRRTYVEVIKSRVHDRHGNPIGIQGVYWDVTARMESERQLHEAKTKLEQSHRALFDSQALYHSLVEHLPVCVYRIDTEGGITFGNSAYLNDVGHTLPELLGKTVYDLFPAQEAEKYDADDRRVLETGEVFHDIEEHDVRGQRLYVEVLKSRVHDHQARPIGVQGIYWDVSARKHAEDQLQRTMAELERSNKELQQFAAVASHDMHAPLRRLAMISQLIQGQFGESVSQELGELLGFIVTSVEHMQELINDLLAHSRIGATDKPPEPVDCQSVVKKAVDNLGPAISESGAELAIGQLPKIVAHRVELVQLFQNLIGNAVKYHGSDPPRVEVCAEPVESQWLFRIKDNGIGIPEKDRETVFDAFRRLHDDERFPGTGLGLATCKKIVEHHDGRIWIESCEQAGCEFLFTLPAATEQYS